MPIAATRSGVDEASPCVLDKSSTPLANGVTGVAYDQLVSTMAYFVWKKYWTLAEPAEAVGFYGAAETVGADGRLVAFCRSSAAAATEVWSMCRPEESQRPT